MESGPQRIQLKRTRGWRMPPNTVKVSRPGAWGNPFVAASAIRLHSRNAELYTIVAESETAVARFRDYISEQIEMHECMREAIAELRGKHLACWCRIGDPCHADVLLEIANKEI